MRLTRRSFLAVTGLVIIGHGTAIAHHRPKSHQALAGIATGKGAAMPSLTVYMGATGIYGPAIGMDGIGNMQVGGPNGVPTRKVAYRFRAATSSNLTDIQFTQTNGAGYWGGTGGTLEITIQSDDGTGLPSGTILATLAPFTPVNIAGYWPKVALPTPLALTKGTIYHAVWRNTDADPATNYPSLNNHVMIPFETPNCPRFPDSDWQALLKDAGAWLVPRPNGTGGFIPQFALFYADGTISGVDFSYLAASVSLPQTETFTPASAHTVSTVKVRANATGVTARLETGAGVEIETVSLGTLSGAWGSASFAGAHTLAAGSTYHLVISGSGTINSMWKGTAYGSWPAITGFPDGNLVGQVDQDLPFSLS
jgi:hypothetical protein